MHVLILGLGQYPHGSGVEAAVFFAKQGCNVLVTDLKTESQLEQNVRRLRKYPNVRFVLGKHRVSDLADCSMVIRNPRVPSHSPILIEARKRGIPIESDLTIFLKSCPCHVVGVTGTRGKSTTSALIAHIIQGSGRRAWLGGNILVSPLSFFSKVKPDDIVVLELSSWQLEALGEQGLSPSIAVWTNLMRDHLNTYSGMKAYAAAKSHIFLHQTSSDIVFLPATKEFDAYARLAPGRVGRIGGERSREKQIVDGVTLKLVGRHNDVNAQYAVAVALELGISVRDIKRGLKTFAGLPDRLELIAIVRGLRCINDTTATTPDATIAAVESLLEQFRSEKEVHTIHLIFGGADKELEFGEIARHVSRSRVQVYLLPGTAHDAIVRAFRRARVVWQDVGDLQEAVEEGLHAAKKGDCLLLSPGCASFGLFANEFERGSVFRRLIKRYGSARLS